MKLFSIILAVVFILFAAVQYNDPDPLVWIGYYLLLAANCILVALDRPHKILLIGAMIISAIWFATYIPHMIEWWQSGMPEIASEMKATTPYIENMRESLGILIGLLAMIFLWWKKK